MIATHVAFVRLTEANGHATAQRVARYNGRTRVGEPMQQCNISFKSGLLGGRVVRPSQSAVGIERYVWVDRIAGGVVAEIAPVGRDRAGA